MRLLAALFLLAMQVVAGTVVGTVELVDSLEASVRRKRDFSGVVVWLQPVARKLALPAPKTFTMLQKAKKFQPHVLAIPVGSTVDFPNLDPIFHNAFSNFAGQPFDTGLYRPGSSQKVQFRREGVVRVFCNIHSTMSAVIVVLDTPYFAVSTAAGAFEIPDVAPGEYRMHVWHERASGRTLSSMERTIAVEGHAVACPPVKISESGYVQVPHKNKFGDEYPPEPSDSLYPGGRK